MNLYEVSPTIHWTPTSDDVRATAAIKSKEHTYELIVRCNRTIPDHLAGWLDKVLDHKEDADHGRFVELSNKDNRSSFAGVDDLFGVVANGVVEQARKQRLKYVYLFSTTPSRRETFEKLSKKIAKKLDWQVYQDRNYFILHTPSLKIHQPD